MSTVFRDRLSAVLTFAYVVELVEACRVVVSGPPHCHGVNQRLLNGSQLPFFFSRLPHCALVSGAVCFVKLYSIVDNRTGMTFEYYVGIKVNSSVCLVVLLVISIQLHYL